MTTESTARPRARRDSAVRFAAAFGVAMAVGQLGQLVWLAAASRTTSRSELGVILSAQVLYGFLQFIVDNGPGLAGARLAGMGGLDEAMRGSVIRMRCQLALVAAPVAAAIGAAGGRSSFVATAPFVAALFLWALLNYWAPYGRGEVAPWGTYLVLRSWLPAVAAGVWLLANGRLPVYAAGCAELAAIVAVSVAFRMTPVRDALLALHAKRGPWRSAINIGLPTVASQLALASGPILLNIAGAAPAAAALAVGLRFVTGTYGLAGVAATAVFPRLVRRDRSEAGLSEDRRGVTFSCAVLCALTSLVSAVLLARPSFFVQIFLNASDRQAQSTVILASATSAGFGCLLTLLFVLIARHEEAAAVPPYLIGTAVTVVLGVVVVASGAGSQGPLMAAALAAGTALSVLLLGVRAVRLAADVAAPLRWATWNVYAAGLAGALGAAFVGVRPALAAAGALAAIASVVVARSAVRPASGGRSVE